ncbi:hypothetical protein FIV38_00445 [Pseudomonas proteolytica]|nr:hypothetical protein F4W61_08630 [Pseudomonas proteolytica]TWR86392.1 hypothetical protein FIV38_00445 [Pseudomonas proteolytica]
MPSKLTFLHPLVRTPHHQCGSGLARDGGVSGITSGTDTPLSRASPLPQGTFNIWGPCSKSGGKAHRSQTTA